MRSMRSRQLTFVFADSPQGGEGARATDESAGKASLLHKAKDMSTSDLIAPAADTGRLLEQGLGAITQAGLGVRYRPKEPDVWSTSPVL